MKVAEGSAEATERVAVFLREGEATISDVLGRISGSIGIDPNDTVFAVGSVPEGHGTPTSDLDIILVTDRGGETMPRTGAVAAGGRVVDLLLLQRSTVTELARRLRAWSARPWDLSMPAAFDLAQRTQLHRFLRGARLAGPLLDFEPTDGLALAKLKLHVARHAARTVQVDLAGYRSMADYASMCYSAQDLLGHAIDGLLAGHGETNPTPKWRSHFLDRLPADWESELPGRSSGYSASALAWKLHRLPLEPAPAPAVDHALLVAAFARRVFLWAESKLFRATTAPLAGRIRRSPSRPNLDVLPSLDLDVDFAGTNGSWRLGRLNSFGPTLEVDDDGIAIAIHCDGMARFDEAASSLRSKRSPSEAHRSVTSFVAKLREAGLLWLDPRPDDICGSGPSAVDPRSRPGISRQ